MAFVSRSNGRLHYWVRDGKRLPIEFDMKNGLLVVEFSVPQLEIRQAVFHLVHELGYRGKEVQVFPFREMQELFDQRSPEHVFVDLYLPPDFSHPRVPRAAVDEVRHALVPWAIRFATSLVKDGFRRDRMGFVTFVGKANETVMRPILNYISPADFIQAREATPSVVNEKAERAQCRALEAQIARWMGRLCSSSSCGRCAPPLRCAKCKHIWYCNAICQRDHWPDHRAECNLQQQQ
jgi:hypothetical protein